MTDTVVPGPDVAPPWSEQQRLAALRTYEILDRPPQPSLDALCRLAAQVCHTPAAAISLIDEARQFFASEIGLGIREAPPPSAARKQMILSTDLLVVPDLERDLRFGPDPFVVSRPHLTFYAGALLRTPHGLPLGVLCVLDAGPGPRALDARQAEALRTLAQQVMTQLENRCLRTSLARREAELAQVHDLAGVGGFEIDLRHGFWSHRSVQYLRLHGLPPEAAREGHEEWVRRLHPEDRREAESRFLDAVRGCVDDYAAEYRIIRPSDGAVRWIAATARIERDAQGRALRLIGAHRDITRRKANEEARELLTRELSHRIKNIFALVGGLATLTARGHAAAEAYAGNFQARLQALALAHEYVRPHGPGSGPVTGNQTVQGLLRTLLAPYAEEGRDRVVVTGDDVPVGERAAAAFALILHEQATNAVKYGALSVEGGQVLIRIGREKDRLMLLWQERGGPALAGAPERQGFGSRMMARSASAQLGGEIAYDWQPKGLVMRITAPISRLAE
ncbi:sensor histidine kinase [Methylobacterium oryzisoli]|uniref:sensor histidine kinase n=1 Tax=Methylobacterium oryzisoli TaxID=3385502 RepID=UPI0038919A69